MEGDMNIRGTRNGQFYLEYHSGINYAKAKNGLKAVIACALTNADEDVWHNVRLTLTGDRIKTCDLQLGDIAPGITLQPDIDIVADEEVLQNLSETEDETFTVCISEEGESIFEQTYAVKLEPDDYYLHLDQTETVKEITKQTIWERKLLDFSLRNNLINCKLGRRVIPFVSFGIDKLEDNLHAGEDYVILPYPEKTLQPLTGGMYDSRLQASHLSQKVEKEIQENRHIISYLNEKDLDSALKFVYRASRNSIEENGANTLFLVLGMLKWFESDRSTIARFAPVVLMPVSIIRKSGTNYVLRTRDEEAILNVTLMELLKQQFGIDLSVLDPLPTDEMGVDVKKILNTVRHATAEQKRWQVMDEAELGLFSFNKFVMWNDIHNNADHLKENDVVKSLMEGRVTLKDLDEVVNAREIDRSSQPSDFCIPIDVDSSQLEAVIESGRGKSFILYGPPGTGKSQTITNMIANALYQGKRVLFVAEKMAALEVVEKRLDKVGLAPFCLELHSNKATKSHFLRQMQKALDVVHIQEPGRYKELSEELFASRQKLIAYIEALHEQHPSGLTLFECISHYLSIGEDERYPTASWTLPAAETVTRKKMETWADGVKSLDTVFTVTGHPHGHPLRGLYPKTNNTDDGQRLMQLLSDLCRTADELEQTLKALPMTLDMTEDDLAWVAEVADTLGNAPSRNALDFLRRDADELEMQWRQVADKWVVSRFFARRTFMKDIHQYSVTTEYENVPTLLDWNRNMRDVIKKYCLAHNSDYTPVEESLFQPLAADRLKAVVEKEKRAKGIIDDILKLADADYEPGRSIASLAEQARTWCLQGDNLRDWCLWVERRKALMADGLKCVVDVMEQKGAAPADAEKAMSRALYQQQIRHIIENNADLNHFNGLIFEDLVEKYKQYTYSFQDLSKKELYCRLAAKIPSQTLAATANSEMGILKRNISNGGRGTSIRKIIDQIPTLLPKLCPCMLMSPISVAQYIDMDGEKFDLVIFDEASQMPTSEAVGAIARGKALICVGDPKQMPPTSFFTTQQVDEDEAEIDDMDSILDDCITLSMPGHYLSWHYRSKHESLIAFSNQQYYEGKLHTFPSVDDRRSKVSLVRVEGEYDKGRTRSNPAEAKAIVEEVLRRLADPELRRLSIGIVSFSKVQQNLIEDVLIEELAKQPELERVAMGMEERIFVKNLENVQGDERDVILFSVGYGPDKEGHVSMNFGPLNNEGGERRLNVAVSRARYEMIVFATLRAEQIDMNRSKAKGVEGLKNFITFAEKGELYTDGQTAGPQESEAREADREMIAQVSAELQRHGYEVVTDVGRSQFKIDIAVVNPERTDEYILGILCDGRKYYETKTVRDREIVQTGVLRGLDWNIMRIWTVDWYSHREQSVQRLLAKLDEAKLHLDPETTASDEAKKVASKAFNLEGMEVEQGDAYRLPKAYSRMDALEIPQEEVRKAAMFVIEQSISVPLDELLRQTAHLIGFNRRTPKTNQAVQQAVEFLEVMGRITVDNDTVTLRS